MYVLLVLHDNAISMKVNQINANSDTDTLATFDCPVTVSTNADSLATRPHVLRFLLRVVGPLQD